MVTDDVWQKRCRRLFALLREAKVTDREDRLNLFRWAVSDPTISSTNDLDYHSLNVVVQMLEYWQREGELVEQAAAHIAPIQGRHL